jgi:hypothetical protein
MRMRLVSLRSVRSTGSLWGFQLLGVRFTLWRDSWGLSLLIYR